MIIDAREASKTKHGRPFTFSAAVANALDTIGLHKSVSVKKAIDVLGDEMKLGRLQTQVNKHKGDRAFTVRQSKDGNILGTITRLR
jgi:hypothetical protein